MQRPASVSKALELCQCLRAPWAFLHPPREPFALPGFLSPVGNILPYSDILFFSPLVECRSAALVLEKWKAQFASPGIPKPLSPGWARWFRGAGMVLSAHVIPARRQHWAVGRQRQAAPGRLPALPAPSVGCGAGKGELPWAPGMGRPLRVTLRITHRLGNHCARQFGRSNQVKSDVYSWGKYNVKKIPQGDGSSARKEETRQKAPADTRVKCSLTWE